MKLFIIKNVKQKNIWIGSEEIILLMFEEYREVANPDRFVLPVGEDIKFFTDIIDKYC